MPVSKRDARLARQRELQALRYEIERREAILEDFARGFKVSRKGSLWREWDGLVLSVFQRAEGWKWCLADSDGPRYSRFIYESAEDAIGALAVEVGLLD